MPYYPLVIYHKVYDKMNAMMSPRETRGLQIAQAKESQVSLVDENFYTVKSLLEQASVSISALRGIGDLPML